MSSKTSGTKPLLKWPGGKRRVIPYITQYVPHQYDTYYEVFFGGGALFFHQQPKKAVLNDINPELINLYKTIQNMPERLITELQKPKYVNTEENFYVIRNLDRTATTYNALTNVEKAARTLFLNKTCFNGLYRVNKNNQFNTPYGKYENPTICDSKLIHNTHTLLTGDIELSNQSFATVLENITTPNNFIYLDPPYIPLTPTSAFTAYSADKFDYINQVELRTLAEKLDAAGNFILLSNSDTPITRELYQNFTIKPIQVTRSISAASTSRTKVGEVLILGKTLTEHLHLRHPHL